MGNRLRPAEDATTVRRRGGKVLVTDGPFAESREWIVGFDVLECRDLDEAIEIAALASAVGRRPAGAAAGLAVGLRRRVNDEVGRAEPPEPVARALADALAAERLGIVAALIRTTGDWDLAEDAVADAAERALRRWPGDGVPDNPAAWLTTTARRRADRPDPPRRHRAGQAHRARARRGTARRLHFTGHGHRHDLAARRPAPADLHLRAPRPADGGSGGAHPQGRRRPVHRGDRAGLPDHRGHHEPAAAPGQAEDRPRRHPLPGAERRRPARAAGRRAGHAVPDLHLRVHALGRRPGRGGDPAGPAAGRTDARLRRDPGAARPDAAAARPPPRPHRGWRAGHARGAGPLALGRRDDHRGAHVGLAVRR